VVQSAIARSLAYRHTNRHGAPSLDVMGREGIEAASAWLPWHFQSESPAGLPSEGPSLILLAVGDAGASLSACILQRAPSSASLASH
jgi:hypothetical protein